MILKRLTNESMSVSYAPPSIVSAYDVDREEQQQQCLIDCTVVACHLCVSQIVPLPFFSVSLVSTSSEQDEPRTQERGITIRTNGRRKHRRHIQHIHILLFMPVNDSWAKIHIDR